MSHIASLAEEVRDLLAQHGMLTPDGMRSSRQAATRTGIPRSTLDRLLVSGDFTMGQLELLERAFGVKPETLVARARKRAAA